MESTGHRSSAASAGSAKHLSMMESTAPKKDPRIRTQGTDNWASGANMPSENPGTEPKRKSRWWIWLIIAAAVLAAAAACYFLFFRNDTSEAAPEEVLVYGLKDPVIFENDECSFIIDAIGEKGDYLELDVRCINKTQDVLSFTWDNTCINGSMFDPLWHVYVQGDSTMKSSITFPLSTLNSYNLPPADQIKFVLRVHNESKFEKLVTESGKHIVYNMDFSDAVHSGNYKKIEGYDGYLFDKSVALDKSGRPYYVDQDKNKVYFDEIYDRNGQPLYAIDSDSVSYLSFYNDRFGRPYYFSKYADTIYYDGYGFAFYDEANDKYYFYDENGDPAYYGNDGIPERYEGAVPQSLSDSEKPESLAKAGGCFIVNKEFSIYPTGKNADDIVRPERITGKNELVYWDGEKGDFIVLGGKKDEFKGYIVQTYVANDSDNYIYFGWNSVVVNGVDVYPDTITVLRPHSSAYRDIIISSEDLENNDIKTVSEIDFNVYAVGENLSVPLYPIEWKATSTAQK